MKFNPEWSHKYGNSILTTKNHSWLLFTLMNWWIPISIFAYLRKNFRFQICSVHCLFLGKNFITLIKIIMQIWRQNPQLDVRDKHWVFSNINYIIEKVWLIRLKYTVKVINISLSSFFVHYRVIQWQNIFISKSPNDYDLKHQFLKHVNTEHLHLSNVLEQDLSQISRPAKTVHLLCYHQAFSSSSSQYAVELYFV